EEFATFNSATAVAPVIGSYDLGDKALTIDFTPGKFNMGFNGKMPVNHALIMVAVDGKEVRKTVATTIKDNVMTASINSINNTLISMGYQEDQTVSFDLILRATMQNPSQDNGRNGYVDAKDRISVSSFTISFPKGSPYMEYTETSPFGVIGSLSNYGISWDGDLEMWMTADGNLHVAKCVTLSVGDEFKFRKDQDWGVNYGGDFGSVGEPFAVSQDGPNIVVKADGLYDLWLDIVNNTATLTEAYQAYPDHKEASNWSVIGSLSEYGISWDGDLTMLTDGNSHVAQGVKLAAADEFKFRQDKDWAVNMGGDFGALGSDFAVTQDGPNIKVGADGIFDLIVNPGAGTAQIVETLGGGVSGKIGGDEPGPEPVPVTGWNIIGLNGDWENDIITTESGSTWTAYVTVAEDTEFKFRKDGGWDENYGMAEGATVTIGEPIPAAAGGPNIPIGPGFWKVVLDTDAMTITISNGEVWSLIGDFNGWAGDIDMEYVDGKWVSPAAHLNANGFKIRHNHDWAESVGGTFVEFRTPFPVGDDNIMLPAEGDYIVTYDPVAGTITVEKSINGWNIIGLNGNWNDDILATENNGVWTVRVNVEDDTEFKWRKDGGWDENYGGTFTALGEPFAAEAGGPNIPLAPGYWLLTLDLSGDTPSLMVSDGLVWSLIGDFNSWGGDVDMSLVDGVWVSPETAISGGFKLRKNHDWAENRGGVMASLGEEFDAVAGGDNISVEEGTYVVYYYPESEKILVANAKKVWSVIGVNGDWSTDYEMSEVAPGIWMSDVIEATSGDWKIRFDHDWTVNRGGTMPEDPSVGNFVGAFQDGPNVAINGTFKVVYNANNETIGTLGWGVIGTINGWGGDMPMNLGSDGSWYSVPIKLTKDDEIKIRFQSDWGVNRGGTCGEEGAPFEVTQDGSNIKAPEEGTYMLIYYPQNEQIVLTKAFWGMIGGFNEWSADVFMMFDGASWVAYNQKISGEWKLRQGADWAVNRGGTFEAVDTAFDVTQDGPNINVNADLTSFSVFYDPLNEKVTIK
nr:hypothetical protein [Bacteroidales bacterium]